MRIGVWFGGMVVGAYIARAELAYTVKCVLSDCVEGGRGNARLLAENVAPMKRRTSGNEAYCS